MTPSPIDETNFANLVIDRGRPGGFGVPGGSQGGSAGSNPVGATTMDQAVSSGKRPDPFSVAWRIFLVKSLPICSVLLRFGGYFPQDGAFPMLKALSILVVSVLTASAVSVRSWSAFWRKLYSVP